MPRPLVEELGRRGHDVVSVASASPGADDTDIFERARVERRVIVTFDKGYGQLVLATRSSGVVIIRMRYQGSPFLVRRVVDVLETRTDWGDYVSVISHRDVRMKSLSSLRQLRKRRG
jgi:predicted nuclease of predicted toxin-antitoxin system